MIRVVVDDLAFIEVDAVVRPSDRMLGPASSGAAQLDHLGGEEFARHRSTANPLDIGSAVVTTGGEIKAPFVIHVVIKSDQDNPDRESVERAWQSAWHRATEWQLGRIATPLVGTGPGQMTMEDAASLLKTSLMTRPQFAYPSELWVVVDRESDRETVAAILEEVTV